MEPGRLYDFVDTSAVGLTEAQAESRRKRYGINELWQENAIRWPRLLAECLLNPFVGLLAVLAGIACILGDMPTVITLGVMIAGSTLLRFIQEARSGIAAECLRAMVRVTATVRRRVEGENPGLEATWNEVPAVDLVPGDIVRLSAGDMVPADLRLSTAKDLFLSQSTLNGEAMPVEKRDRVPSLESGKGTPLFDLESICFAGTSVVSGSGTGVVVLTGRQSYLGAMATTLNVQRDQTSFDKGINSLSWLLARFSLAMVLVMLLVGGALRGNWLESLMFGLAVGVGLTPEMLPMVVSGALARGAIALSRKGAIVKRLSAIQNLGAMDVLCVDKTGTLTQDRVILERHMNAEGLEDALVLKLAYLNSYFQTGLKNLLDKAVLTQTGLKGAESEYLKFDEIPFDFRRRRMSVILHHAFHGEEILVCKGAVEETLQVCDKVRVRGVESDLSPGKKRELFEIGQSLSSDGMRVLAVGSRTCPSNFKKQYQIHDEEGLVFEGFIAFLDPPKEDAALALKALKDLGVGIRVISGDNEQVTGRICHLVGIEGEGKILLGSKIEDLDDDELAEAMLRHTVFAKVTPFQKARLVRALQRRGKVVGFLGDGINDAAALRAADVGISVEQAVDIAKEAADIILLQRSLLVLHEAISQGRSMFANIMKYVKMTASSNFGNVLSVMVASFLLPFLPMLPLQLLMQNLIYDFSQTLIPWDRVDSEQTCAPLKWDASGVLNFMLWVGPVSSIFDFLLFGLMWWGFSASVPGRQGLFQSGWFVEGLLSQTLIVHLIRTPKVPFLQSRASWQMILATLAVIAGGQILPYISLGKSMGLQPLPGVYFVWLWVILGGYAALTQFVKSRYIRRYNAWI